MSGPEFKRFDQAFLYNKYSDNVVFIRWFEKFLNAVPSSGGPLIPDELPKEEWEVTIIEQAKDEVGKRMSFFHRSKEIDIPISMIYIVPEKNKYDSLFRLGIVVERSSSKCCFTAKVFQELFCRTSFQSVLSDENKKLSYVDGGTMVLKKGIASLEARKFIKQSIAEGLFDEDDVSEDFFDLESEKVFKLFLREFWLQDKSLSRDDCFNIFVEAVINEESFSKLLLERKSNSTRLTSLGGMNQKVSLTG